MNSFQTSKRSSDAETSALIEKAIERGSIRYLHGCESRVEGFVRKHYSFRGALRNHSHAIGWDIVRMPINIVWSVVNILLAIVGSLAGLVRLRRLQERIRHIPPGLETDMDRQIRWLIITELLQLPYEDGSNRSERDALMEEIVKEPSLRKLLDEKLQVFERPSQKPEFQNKLHAKLAEYGATRTGSADLASNAALLITSKAAMGQASFGALSAGTAVSAVIANSVAVSNFWLGSAIGAYYYALVPVAVSVRLLIAVTAVIAVVLALLSTFIGILTDPIQTKLGLHQKRLRKLINSVRNDLQGRSGSNFELREKYSGRLFDVVDVLTTVGRAM